MPQPSLFPLRPTTTEATDDPSKISEDCLYINVSAPKQVGARLKPVMVWIHGGGFSSSSGPALVGDGSQFARNGIVVVTFNYRLGALGFLHLADLLGPDYASSGCCGLLDQVAALKWVRENIEAFGGDPSQVTIAGNSAGAKSVAALLAMPRASGLFTRAISQSGGQHVLSKQAASSQADRFLYATRVGRGNARSLLNLSPEMLLWAQTALGSGVKASWIWRPTVDGFVMPEDPVAAIDAGSASGIEVLAGTNSNEAATYDVLDATAAEQAPRVIGEIFGDDAAQFWDVYRESCPQAGDRALWRAAMGDERYVVPTIRMLDAQSKHATVWRYRFDCPGHLPKEFAGGHGTEMGFIFKLSAEPMQPSRQAVALGMHARWSNFIRGELPEAGSLTWPPYEPKYRNTLIFDELQRVECNPSEKTLALWEARDLPETTWWPDGPSATSA